ncbi:Metal ABC transporter ATP-binding protein OS=Streptomyces alboniger OX=132473 GN=CP975_11280 PE=4 SV=1 [Streptomyces alboniger]
MPERGSTLGEKAHEALQEPVIALRDATATLGSRPVLRGVDLTVHRGEVVALLGANGSGKSTAVRSVIGQVPLDRRERGAVRHRAAPLPPLGPDRLRPAAHHGGGRRARHDPRGRRLGPAVPYAAAVAGKADRAAVDRAIELVGLADRAKDSVSALSGGQHQRVLIARALASEPEVLIMDEPMAGVDLASQEILASTLRHQVAEGASDSRAARAGPAGAPDRPGPSSCATAV